MQHNNNNNNIIILIQMHQPFQIQHQTIHFEVVIKYPGHSSNKFRSSKRHQQQIISQAPNPLMAEISSIDSSVNTPHQSRTYHSLAAPYVPSSHDIPSSHSNHSNTFAQTIFHHDPHAPTHTNDLQTQQFNKLTLSSLGTPEPLGASIGPVDDLSGSLPPSIQSDPFARSHSSSLPSSVYSHSTTPQTNSIQNNTTYSQHPTSVTTSPSLEIIHPQQQPQSSTTTTYYKGMDIPPYDEPQDDSSMEIIEPKRPEDDRYDMRWSTIRQRTQQRSSYLITDPSLTTTTTSLPTPTEELTPSPSPIPTDSQGVYTITAQPSNSADEELRLLGTNLFFCTNQ